MTNFTKTFETKEGVYYLTFTKIESLTAKKYFVISRTSTEVVAAFEMKQNKEGIWKVIEPAPACIIQAEHLLRAAIKDNNQLIFR